MKHDPETLAQSLRSSSPLLTRYLDGFEDANRTAQAPGIANHAAWTMGHLALVLSRCAQMLDGRGLPEEDFLSADGRGGTAERFDTESVCYGSVPGTDPALYPLWDRCRGVFDAALERTATAFGDSTPERLADSEKWGASEVVMGDLATRMAVHIGMHAGQIIDLRRGLGMGRVVG